MGASVLDPKHFPGGGGGGGDVSEGAAAELEELEDGIHEEFAQAMARAGEETTARLKGDAELSRGGATDEEAAAAAQSAALQSVCTEEDGWSDLLGGSGSIFSKTTAAAAPDAPLAEYGGRARVHIEGRLLLLPSGESGSLFFSTEDDRDTQDGLRLRVGDDDHPLVPAGLMLGVRMMAEGQSCIVRCAAKYGYGSTGWNGVPLNSTLEYKVSMLECSPASAPVSNLEAAIERKELGNVWFRAGRYPSASRCYKAGVHMVGNVSSATVAQAKGDGGAGSEEAAAMLEVALALGNNHCRAEEKAGNFSSAKEALIGVLTRDPANLKALLAAARLGVKTDEIKEAEAALSKCKELINADHSMHGEMAKLAKLLKEAKRKEKQREKDLFGGKLRRRTVKVGGGDLNAPPEAAGQDETDTLDEPLGSSVAASEAAQTGPGIGEDDTGMDNLAADAVVSSLYRLVMVLIRALRSIQPISSLELTRVVFRPCAVQAMDEPPRCDGRGRGGGAGAGAGPRTHSGKKPWGLREYAQFGVTLVGAIVAYTVVEQLRPA